MLVGIRVRDRVRVRTIRGRIRIGNRVRIWVTAEFRIRVTIRVNLQINQQYFS
jgi:hypothetical protein